MTSPAILMAAPNGARRGKEDHPNLPVTCGELALEAVRCRDAGAAALHLHVRDAEGAHSLDPELYLEAMAAVREAVGSELVLQITTEAVGRYSAEEQMRTVRAAMPEAVSVALREISPEGADETPAREFLAWLAGEGIWTQIILYDVADVMRFVRLHQGGLFAVRRPSLLLVLGRYSAGQLSEPADLDPLLSALGPTRHEVEWSLCAFGPKENECVAQAFALGGHGRVGFENNLWLPDGSPASYTSDLVALGAVSAKAAQRRLATPGELRDLVKTWI